MLQFFYIHKKPWKYSDFFFPRPCRYAWIFPISLNMQPIQKILADILINSNIIESILIYILIYRIYRWKFSVKIQFFNFSVQKSSFQKTICGLIPIFCCQSLQRLFFGWSKFFLKTRILNLYELHIFELLQTLQSL